MANEQKRRLCVDRLNFIISALHQTDHSLILILFQTHTHTELHSASFRFMSFVAHFKNTFRIKEQNNQKRSKLMKKMHIFKIHSLANHPMKLH